MKTNKIEFTVYGAGNLKSTSVGTLQGLIDSVEWLQGKALPSNFNELTEHDKIHACLDILDTACNQATTFKRV